MEVQDVGCVCCPRSRAAAVSIRPAPRKILTCLQKENALAETVPCRSQAGPMTAGDLAYGDRKDSSAGAGEWSWRLGPPPPAGAVRGAGPIAPLAPRIARHWARAPYPAGQGGPGADPGA